MNKVATTFAVLICIVTVSAFADYHPGRVDTIVSCNAPEVNGYSIQITNVEGTRTLTAAVFHGGIVGPILPSAPTVEVAMTSQNFVTRIVDTSTGGQMFKLIVKQKSGTTPTLNSKVSFKLGSTEASNLLMFCKFPAHTM